MHTPSGRVTNRRDEQEDVPDRRAPPQQGRQVRHAGECGDGAHRGEAEQPPSDGLRRRQRAGIVAPDPESEDELSGDAPQTSQGTTEQAALRLVLTSALM
jgi:hypothetical protein